METFILQQRLLHQKIDCSDIHSPAELVRYMGVMQAQDFTMAKWALAGRLKVNKSESEIEQAFNNGEFLRTHVLRPTWHFVHADDLHWMVKLSRPHIQQRMTARNRALELGTKTLNRSFDIITKALNNHSLNRSQIFIALEHHGISTINQRGVHILFEAELEALICSGPMQGRQQSWSLADNRISKKYNYTREEALYSLAVRYFRSHGPASIADFKWWSNLPAMDEKKAMKSIKNEVDAIEHQGVRYYYYEELTAPTSGVHLLPAFDEYIISYKDRSAMLPADIAPQVISNNGIFRPVIIREGKVQGLWKKSSGKNHPGVEIQLFDGRSLPRQEVEKVVKRYCGYLEG